jgi:universal stress protein A
MQIQRGEDVAVFRQILCATDFSDTAEAAWEVACELTRIHQASLVLVHVFVDLPVYAYSDLPAPNVVQIWEEQRQWVERALGERVAAARSRGLTAESRLLTGSAPDSIVECAAQERSDLIVIGTHGRTGLARLVIGSVAERVVRIAPCAVLTVKPPAAREPARAAA